MSKSSKIIVACIAAALAVAGSIISWKAQRSRLVYAFGHDGIQSAIDLNMYDDTTKGLITGFNYFLLKRMADEVGEEISIRKARNTDVSIDSLRSGAIDILVLPFDELDHINDSTETVIHVDSISTWVVRKHNKAEIRFLKKWMGNHLNSESYKATHQLFMGTYEPFATAKAGIKKEILSPYDSLIRQGADSLGWDWRFLTSVIYQESRFRINASSHAGAEGLMQIMPSTAKSLDINNILDPEESIMAGVSYLRRIQRMFRRRFTSDVDLRKVVLAAYCAGEGCVIDCIRAAEENGELCQDWEVLSEFLPAHAVYYNKRIESYYWAFCTIHPKEMFPY